MLNHSIPPKLVKMLVNWPEQLSYNQNKNAQSFSIRMPMSYGIKGDVMGRYNTLFTLVEAIKN